MKDATASFTTRSRRPPIGMPRNYGTCLCTRFTKRSVQKVRILKIQISYYQPAGEGVDYKVEKVLFEVKMPADLEWDILLLQYRFRL